MVVKDFRSVAAKATALKALAVASAKASSATADVIPSIPVKIVISIQLSRDECSSLLPIRIITTLILNNAIYIFIIC
jgi:hypothetical protein